MGNRKWLTVAAAVPAFLWLQAEFHRWQLRHQMEHTYVGNVTVQVIDADTKAPLNVGYYCNPVFSSTTGPGWPKAAVNTVAATDDNKSTKVSLRWIDVGDVKIRILSEGYEPVPLTLNAGTPSELVVPLRRSDHAHEQTTGPAEKSR